MQEVGFLDLVSQLVRLFRELLILADQLLYKLILLVNFELEGAFCLLFPCYFPSYLAQQTLLLPSKLFQGILTLVLPDFETLDLLH